MYHIGCAINLHSITNSGLIPEGQNSSRERQTVFFTVVHPMDKKHKDTYEIDFTEPRLAWYKQKQWKRHQDTACWVDIQLAQQKGFKFNQTRSNAIILFGTLPAYCIPKVVRMETGEVIYEKVYVSPRPPPPISFKDNWMKELDSEVAGGYEDSQQIQRKSKTQLSRRGDPWVGNHLVCLLRRSEKMSRLVAKAPMNEQGDLFFSSCVPVSVERADKDEDADWNVDADQTRTVRPVSGQPAGLFTQLEEIDVDFRVLGLSHAVVKEAENFRVQELVKNIESHPHREALQADLQQSNVYNPFSNNSSNDPWIGQCGVIRVVRNYPKSTMFSMSSLLESRNDQLHLRRVLGWKRIQKKA